MTYTNVFNPETSFLFYNAVSQQVLSTVMFTPCWCQITFLHLSLSQIFCGAPVISIGPEGGLHTVFYFCRASLTSAEITAFLKFTNLYS